jgi:putative ABC transport system permease protein
MLLHYGKNGWRYITRHLSFSLINILGLSLGIASCLLIYLYVDFELSYDRYNEHADRIVRVTTTLYSPETTTPIAYSPLLLAPALLRDDPQLESAVRIEELVVHVRKGREVIKEEQFWNSEQTIFSVFSFSFVEGSAAAALTQPNSIVLDQSMARKYFGNGPALGKTLNCNGHDLRVTAVFADRPANSNITINALLQKDFSKATNWIIDDFSAYTFLLFRGKPDLPKLATRLAGLAVHDVKPELDNAGAKGYHVSFETQRLKDLHFTRSMLADTEKGSRQSIALFSLLAAFILIIALLNYINLSTAKATERAKEVGIRKTIGARPGQLIRQFLGESFFLMALAWCLAFVLAAAGIPLLNKALSTHLSVARVETLLFLVIVFPLAALLAGVYPALVLARFSPLKSLKGKPVGQGGIGLRKALTIVQFMIALGMLAGTVVIYNQMRYIDHRDLGVDRTDVLGIGLPTDSFYVAQSQAFREALRQESGIRGITIGSGLPVGGPSMSSTTAFSGGRKREFFCVYIMIDPQFLPLMHIRLKEGRNLSDSFSTDKKEAFLVNEAFVRSMGWKSAIGQPLEGSDHKGKIVGVVEDFFYKSLHNAVDPTVMVYHPDQIPAVMAKTSPQELPRIKALWAKYFPSLALDYQWMEKDFEEQYAQDRMTLLLFDIFTGLAIFISCLGLYGLVSLITVQRTKEIGIRKVLGASMGRLVSLFVKDLLKLVVWASILAIPLAVWGMTRWLSSYAFHISIKPWMLILPVVAIGGLAFAVTALRIIRTALANPVESLRTE